MKNTSLIFAAILASPLFAPQAFSAELVKPELIAYELSPAAKDDALYNDGTRAINEGRWSDAVDLFNKVVQMRGERAEGALYWRAYAENKEGQSARALSTCAELRRTYPKSKWLDECGALEIEIHSHSGQLMSPEATQDDELKLLALSAIMQQDESHAIPAIQQILAGNSSDKLKERALFVLSQSDSKQAQDLIGQIARGQSNPTLQIRAIRMLSIRGRQSVDVLADIYQHTTNVAVKKAILQAYVVTNSPDKLVEAARNETDPQLIRTAVHTLGALGATTQLQTLYSEAKSPEIKAEIINSLIPAGHKGAEVLGNIATTEQDPDLRRKAIRNLGIAGGSEATPKLLAIYQNSADPETKKAAVQALFLANDAHDLVTLAKTEKDPALKQSIVQQLSIMHNPEATAYMLEILNK
ncbi:HEAT repeat protein [Edaphobacter aggregans]|uniref:HEAT repeat protein n=1 Tax=Edaphobacter aggregans TaxID=570835 RepID=A0A3R9QJ60_9BACT|nr:HEAT repeat domain-containing protein [Edaphobacter aggregans]RSL17756.1 HEAT repeat protein [Edaphobacter aggregans]